MLLDCEIDPNAVEVAQAKTFILDHMQPAAGIEQCRVEQALDRVLAKPVAAAVDVPPAANSAMDGYALAYDDIDPRQQSTVMGVAGTAWAGRPFSETRNKNQCIRIMTGAWMPDGCDTVIMQEHTERHKDTIRFDSSAVQRGANVRHTGEDIHRGSRILAAGKRMTPADMGLAASVGIAQLTVYKPLSIAVFTTGDELQLPVQPLADGQIYNSNRYTLDGMLQRLHVNVIQLGNIHDNKAALRRTLLDASSQAHAMITTGGVSVGDADYIKPLLDELGEVLFWKIAMKPGRPFTFGKIGPCWFFGLPGNPVSVMATFYQLVQPALLSLAGQTKTDIFTIKARCETHLRKKPGRADYQRAVVRRGEDGELRVIPTGEQGSHILSSMSQANCFIVLDRQQGNVEAGQWVQVQLFSSFFA